MRPERKILWRKRLGLSEPTEIKSSDDEKKRPRLSKKAIVALCSGAAAVVVSVTVFLCVWFLLPRKGEGYYRYFNNFTSSQTTRAEKKITLSEKAYVDSYEPLSGIFITARDYVITGGDTVTYYGLASEEKEYCPPVYGAIVQVKGDYAVVARQPYVGENMSMTYLDLIRFRGDEKAPYSMLGEESVPYSGEDQQFLFVGEYLLAYGTVHELPSQPAYATFYEYIDKPVPLEVFRVRHAYDSDAGSVYTFGVYDDFLVGYSRDCAYFYNVKASKYAGYLEERECYEAFGDMKDSLSSFTRDMKVFYLGNGWFLRSALIYKTRAFEGFNLLIPTNSLSHYARTKTDFYNVITGQSRTNNELFYVENVANRYTYSYFTEASFLLGSLSEYLQDGERYEYDLPFANPAGMIKDGYSIVYYYYLPHIDEFPYDNEQFLGYTGEVTYCLLDENLAFTQPTNALMPTAYIDDVGVQTSDPEFTETRGTAYAYDQFMNGTVLATFKQGKESYIPYYANKEACIVSVARLSETEEDTAEERFGAVAADGARITDFTFEELTFFSGGYAVGYKNGKYYRVDGKGKETEIDDVYMLRQGTYIYKDGEKYGVKNYAGDVLIEAVDGFIRIGEITMTRDGKALRSYAIVRRGGETTIYELL